MENYKLLIDILLNKNISLAERDDAAMDLAQFDEESVLSTLVKIAQDNTEDYILLSSCGESIAEILLRRKLDYTETIESLTKPARLKAEALINSKFKCRLI